MSTSSRTLVCRIAFVLLVALPTCATLGYVAKASLQPLSLTPKAWSSLLSDQTGLEISIGKLQRTTLGVFVLENFELGDPESDAIWISAPRVEALLDSKGLTLSANGATVEAASLRKLGEYLQHRVLRTRKKAEFQPITILAQDCKLKTSSDELPEVAISKLELRTYLDQQSPALEVQAVVPQDGVEVHTSLQAWRNRDANEATTDLSWKIKGGEGISTLLLAELSPQWAQLGRHAKFSGSGLIKIGGQSPNYEFTGIQIRDIDLSTLGQAWGIKHLSGYAYLHGSRAGDDGLGARAIVHGGQFTDLLVELQIAEGTIDRELFGRIARALRCQPASFDGLESIVKFDECALSLELLSDQLKVRGLLERGQAVMTQDRNILIAKKLGGPIDARDCLGALFAEVHSAALPTSQFLAAIPEPRKTNVPAALTARKKGSIR